MGLLFYVVKHQYKLYHRSIIYIWGNSIMNDVEQRKAAKQFADFWEGKGYEKGQSQSFWLSLLHKVFGIEEPEKYITFEDQVHLDHTSFIDGYIENTRVLIEQKSLDKDLNKAIKQSDGSFLTPFQQAKRYITELPVSKHPRWVVTCNFSNFYVYDMEQPSGEPEIIYLKDLSKEYYRLSFLVDSENEHLKREMEVSIEAGEIVGEIYDAFSKQYANPDSIESLKSLNVLCVRLVFCLYAEDAGLFGHHNMFHDYLAGYDTRGLRRALKDLFKVLDTKPEDRDPYLKDDNPMLAAFPYVNGGLFSNEEIEIPPFTDEIKELLVKHASSDFDWSEISPTIFGAVFESTLNPETRRSGGMHYTSIENIHKLIDPLFLDDLKKELQEIKEIDVLRTRKRKLKEYQKKLSELKFLDPACGSGNFLTETYLSLRRLENQVMALLVDGQMGFGFEEANPIMVSINQFYGIEINDFAATVAKTALWIAESQMMKETEEILLMNLDFLPLKSYTNIIEGNALRIEWEDVVSKYELDYIIGNPPFVANTGRTSDAESHSKKTLSEEQAKERYELFGKDGGTLDYVACWYKKAAIFMKGTSIRTAFVSTDSITQGQQVAPLWEGLLNDGLYINFAYESFKWKNDSNEKSATVYVVIIGISYVNTQRLLYTGKEYKKVDCINAYLKNAPNVIVKSRTKPLCKVPSMSSGGKPVEGGFLIFSDKEKKEFLLKEPKANPFFKKFTSGESFLKNQMKWCLWLEGITPKQIQAMPEVKKRIESVRNFRLLSKKDATRKCAETPHLFMEIKQPNTDYLIIPLTTSRNRRYIPIGYMSKDVIANNGASFIPNATKYHFGVLTSNVHMAWMRTVCGYYGPSYRYSNKIVYNNFPWPTPTETQKEKIEKTAQGILDARALYPDSSLADLYDELTMPPELRRAHQLNDKAVMEAYGITSKSEEFRSESACVAMLMNMYKDLTEK